MRCLSAGENGSPPIETPKQLVAGLNELGKIDRLIEYVLHSVYRVSGKHEGTRYY